MEFNEPPLCFGSLCLLQGLGRGGSRQLAHAFFLAPSEQALTEIASSLSLCASEREHQLCALALPDWREASCWMASESRLPSKFALAGHAFDPQRSLKSGLYQPFSLMAFSLSFRLEAGDAFALERSHWAVGFCAMERLECPPLSLNLPASFDSADAQPFSPALCALARSGLERIALDQALFSPAPFRKPARL